MGFSSTLSSVSDRLMAVVQYWVSVLLAVYGASLLAASRKLPMLPLKSRFLTVL